MSEPNGAASLVPSQAMTSNSNNNNDSNNNIDNASNNRRNRRRNNNKKEQTKSSTATSNGEAADGSSAPPKRNNNRRRNNNKPKPKNGDNLNGINKNEQAESTESKPQVGGNNNRRKQKKTNNRKKFPWRKFVSDGSVDPITLEPLVSLSYPPFALCADAPYLPVPEWPVPKEKKAPPPNKNRRKGETEEERERRVLQEQWGAVPDEVEDEAKAEVALSLSQRTFNLFDGRALAYYMVSQLQFIDPLNRRDLTRDELVELNRYLRRHGFNDLSVVEAYDSRGITMSTAGAAASTEAGRAQIRQQEAQLLAHSLLDNVFAGNARASNTSNALQQQYAASQRQEQQQQQQRRRNQNRNHVESQDRGIYGTDAGGLIVIDDDANPGLRGGGVPADASLAPNAPSFTPGSLWSASHITNRYQSHSESAQANNFPALAAATPPAAATAAPRRAEAPAAAPIKKGPSRSLARITKLVAKTDQKELQKQRDARELFVKRAAMTNLEFGTNLSDRQAPSGLLMPPSASLKSDGAASEGQLLRNQAFASALGVIPATMRQQQQQVNYNEGWARPTGNTVQLDEFGNELSAVNYPDSLIVQAREKMGLLLKLEKKWTSFLADDKAASLPLNKMDRESRAFVHEYSDHWKLHTESFDREPNRYIHCVKLRDTGSPNPLLSEAARNWRGPRPIVVDLTDHALKQTAGQTPREFPPPPDREKLQLKPRTGSPTFPQGNKPADGIESNALMNTRSDELFSGRARPKLDLTPRTLPVDLPPVEKAFSLVEERERQKATRAEQIRLRKKEEEKKRRLLESAFASDDEEQSLKSHDSDEWDDVDEQVAMFSGSDEE